ncbi:hypothetical protein [Singulisphaera acidiphila]|uniref:Uncharacterized protein n=1 Tax=Singulisphaera acidiphila (strain ATCC BAA-1392 / DSM 18658 / VKM B-2454 / MOB10) TaxID=886293 RepID=L0D8X4_SINAD|nr:hypothetical protein [Singulisphaera acidiphila]AGA25283.1 hypothetical protein Sinac_0878 [Singulisphaera acidiphila DSM 18658]
MKTLLVMTAGQTDAQLVVNDQRHKLDGNTCGTLHDAIKERSWSVVDAPSTRSRDLIKTLPDGDVKLCTPKLDAVLAHFGDAPPTSALIFETVRQDARDPRLSGEIMERRLHDRGVNQVIRVAFLTGTEQLEDPSNDVDAVVRRTIVAMLSDAIKKQVEQLTKNDKVFVATTGGLAAANELINELVRLHAVGGPTVTALEVPDGDRAQQDDRVVEEKFHPAAGYRARWHALSLVEKGSLLGAWGAVSHLEGVPDQEWTQVIKWLARFASSLPLPTACDLAVLSHHRMAVRAAVRVELALRAEDIPRAVHGTVAVFEAALWDKLGERIERSSDPDKRRFFKVKSGDAPMGDKLLRKGDGTDEDRKRPFELKETVADVAWYWVYDSDGGPGAHLANDFIGSDALKKFDAALVKNNIRELRNDVAHNEPTPELMNDARTRMQSAKLWSNNDTFLSQSLVQAVLKELGEQCPEQLCIHFVSTIRERLLAIS